MNIKCYNILMILLNSIIKDLEMINNLYSRCTTCYVVGNKLTVTIIIPQQRWHGKQLMNMV